MEAVGPVGFMVVAFPGEEPSEWVATAVRKVEINGAVRVVDALLVCRAAGVLAWTRDLSDVATPAPGGDYYGLADLGLELIGVDGAHLVADRFAPSRTALARLAEHPWARETLDAVGPAGGRLVGAVRVPYACVADAIARHGSRARRPASRRPASRA